MESAKEAVSITKYFVSLPHPKVLISFILLSALIFGALIGGLHLQKFDFESITFGSAMIVLVVAFPSIFTSVVLNISRRKVNFARALAVALLSCITYSFFYFLAIFFIRDFVYVGFGISFLVWLVILKFAFGLERSCWIFATLQSILHLGALIFASFLFAEAIEDSAIKIALSSLVFVFLLYSILFMASRPLKKNLGISSSDAISLFASQWLYQDNEIEDAFDEMGEIANTWVAVARFKTNVGVMDWVVPYFHFGPFGNLGGAQFSALIESRLKTHISNCTFVFHGTATHDLDPVKSDCLDYIIDNCNEAISEINLRPAYFSYRLGKKALESCHHMQINNDVIFAFTRAPQSTEDVNLAIGWALMENARLENGDSIAIDCHNCESEDVDYVEPGSKESFDMLDALENAKSQKRLMEAMRAGWACDYPKNISSVASGGIKVACFDSASHKPIFYVLIDSNSIIANAREKLIDAIKKQYSHARQVEIFTTDSHELNAVRGVFNPAGVDDYDELESAVLELAKKAHDNLSAVEFGMVKKRIKLKVLGPYQSSEIVSTFNAVFSLLKIAIPVGILGAVLATLWILTKV